MTDTSREALIKRLRLGASISRDRRINEDFAGIADEAADMLEADERLNVGDSRFEGWYSELQQAGKGSKQIAREAYEAGLNEAQQVAVAEREPLSTEQVSFMCRKHLWIHATSFEDAYLHGFRDAERAHGIGAKP